MKFLNLCGALLVAGGLSACGTVDTASRAAQDPDTVTAVDLSALSAQWKLVDVRVTVPDTLTVSEANMYYPLTDIVWRGDPFGDRRVQISKLMDEGMTRGLAHLDGPRPVNFDIVLERFHSLTEKARYSFGGVHNIEYTLLVSDAQTGQPLHGPQFREVALKAFGGEQAFEAERRGQTQKVRIMDHLTFLMQSSFPGDSFVVRRTGEVTVEPAS